jgi:endonuclease/exonuclease/phosphatase family metal-dependent hydrolase
LLGRDFNLIREQDDKNCDNYNHNLMDIFNEFIGSYQLRELKRSSLRYTWTNKQNIPIMVNLDRVMFSLGWEERFPSSVSWGLTRIGSDHVPIVVDNGESLNLGVS